jgi:hypothetical protein
MGIAVVLHVWHMGMAVSESEPIGSLVFVMPLDVVSPQVGCYAVCSRAHRVAILPPLVRPVPPGAPKEVVDGATNGGSLLNADHPSEGLPRRADQYDRNVWMWRFSMAISSIPKPGCSTIPQSVSAAHVLATASSIARHHSRQRARWAPGVFPVAPIPSPQGGIIAPFRAAPNWQENVFLSRLFAPSHDLAFPLATDQEQLEWEVCPPPVYLQKTHAGGSNQPTVP